MTGKPSKAQSSAAERVYLIDTMSFIFRAYHAMVRQRSMSTKTGLPTAATYVFVNMLRKLREDFSPQYLQDGDSQKRISCRISHGFRMES